MPTQSVHRLRLDHLMKKLKVAGVPAALVVGASPTQNRNRDTQLPHRQSSDFFYLTGMQGRDRVLLVSSELKRPLLLTLKTDKTKVLWEGKEPDMASQARVLGADLVVVDDLRKEALSRIKGTEILFYQNEPGTVGAAVSRVLFDMQSGDRAKVPYRFAHLDALIADMRLIKDPEEIFRIEEGCAITAESVANVVPMIRPGIFEWQIKETLEYGFKMAGCKLAFESIVASGPSAATLHYSAHNRKLKDGDLLMIDCGAEHQMYASDLTRVFPVGGTFNPIQRVLYQTVLNAQYAAMATIKDGQLVKKVYEAASEQIIRGLISLKLLKGNVKALLKKGAQREFFPHGIGHPLGLDVHDVGDYRGNPDAVLRAGMVFTVEPGIYIPKAIGKVPACGIRIEDSVLVTKGGCEILSNGLPRELNEVEEFMAQS